MSRWDWLYEAKALPAEEAVVGQLGRVLIDEFAMWPPRLEWTSGGIARYPRLSSDDLPRPSAQAMREAFRLLEWELLRDVAAIDHHRRSRLRAACGSMLQTELALFVFDYLREAFSELFERTEGRVKRAHVLAALPSVCARFVAHAADAPFAHEGDLL